MKHLYIDIYTYIIVCMYIYINNILYYINKYIFIIYFYITKP